MNSLVIGCLVGLVVCVFASTAGAAPKTDRQIQEEIRQSEFIEQAKEAAEKKRTAPVVSANGSSKPVKNRPDDSPVSSGPEIYTRGYLQLKDGNRVDGFIAEIVPAMVILTNGSATIKVKVTDLSWPERLALPDDISGPYRKIVSQRDLIADQMTLLEELNAKVVSNAVDKAVEKMIADETIIFPLGQLGPSGLQVMDNIKAKVVEEAGSHVKISWKVGINNRSQTPQKKTVRFTFLDEKGFVLNTENVYDAVLPAGEMATISSTCYMKAATWQMVKTHSVKIDD